MAPKQSGQALTKKDQKVKTQPALQAGPSLKQSTGLFLNAWTSRANPDAGPLLRRPTAPFRTVICIYPRQCEEGNELLGCRVVLLSDCKSYDRTSTLQMSRNRAEVQIGKRWSMPRNGDGVLGVGGLWVRPFKPLKLISFTSFWPRNNRGRH
ncbi:hypothetical protein B0E43_08755 [Algoriphagus sp. A40]|nr:hypothetical protein B0E43_08755 [Algoriphagus sp. A40]